MNNELFSNIRTLLREIWETYPGWSIALLDILYVFWIGPDLLNSDSNLGVLAGVAILFGLFVMTYRHLATIPAVREFFDLD